MLFSGAMVRAVLAGTKTQTRRIVESRSRLHPELVILDYGKGDWPYLSDDGESEICNDSMEYPMPCPHGVAGDHLYVRETWGYHPDYPETTRRVCYRADLGHQYDGIRWRPSIHMPHWASRITLEVTGVRVERLQDINAKDIMAEGAVARAHDDQFGHNPVSAFDGKVYLDLRTLWAFGWDGINAARASWASNPFVWVVEFRRIDRELGA